MWCVCHLTMNDDKRDGADEQSKTPARLRLVLAGGEKSQVCNEQLPFSPTRQVCLTLVFCTWEVKKKNTLKDSHTMSFWHKSDGHDARLSLIFPSQGWNIPSCRSQGCFACSCSTPRSVTVVTPGVLEAQLDVIRPGWRSPLCAFQGKRRPITLGKYWPELPEQPTSLPPFTFPVSPQGLKLDSYFCDEAFVLYFMFCFFVFLLFIHSPGSLTGSPWLNSRILSIKISWKKTPIKTKHYHRPILPSYPNLNWWLVQDVACFRRKTAGINSSDSVLQNKPW